MGAVSTSGSPSVQPTGVRAVNEVQTLVVCRAFLGEHALRYAAGLC